LKNAEHPLNNRRFGGFFYLAGNPMTRIMKVSTLTFLLLLVTGLAPSAFAEEAPTYDRVSFSASAIQDVENDILVAELFAQAEGPEASSLASDVNERVSRAVEEAKAIEGIKVETLDYQTHPVYRNKRVDGWSVSQAIRLESSDGDKLSDLIGSLQQNLSVRSVGYEVSPRRREIVEDDLRADAIAKFRESAQRITEAFGKRDYRLVQVNVSSGGFAPPPRVYASRAMAMEAAPAPPTLESGTQEIRVEVSGTIELR